MDIYHIKWTKLQARILRLLCVVAGQILGVREIARILKISPTAVSNSLTALEKDALISINKTKNANLLQIGLNRGSSKAIEFKRAENLRMLYESEILPFLEDTFPGSAIILFGSYSLGEDVWPEKGDRSDIDIAIIGHKEKNVNLSKYESILKREIIMNFYPSLAEIHKNLRENILRGIVLSGGIEL